MLSQPDREKPGGPDFFQALDRDFGRRRPFVNAIAPCPCCGIRHGAFTMVQIALGVFEALCYSCARWFETARDSAGGAMSETALNERGRAWATGIRSTAPGGPGPAK